MTLDELRAICAPLPGTWEDVKWGADLCFCVGEKMYAITGLESPNISLKVDGPEASLAWCARAGVEPAPYLARYHWIMVRPGADLSVGELAELVRGSYALVKAKLPRRVRDAIG